MKLTILFTGGMVGSAPGLFNTCVHGVQKRFCKSMSCQTFKRSSSGGGGGGGGGGQQQQQQQQQGGQGGAAPPSSNKDTQR